MRGIELDGGVVDDQFIEFMETCVQCRGCEPACPSNVEFGSLMEQTRDVLARDRRITPWWQRLGFAALSRHRLLLAGSTTLAVAQRLRLVPKRLGLARLPIKRPAPLVGTGTGVWLYTGCVMDAWQRDVHHATAALIGAVGETFAVPERSGCCGALHVHAGLHDQTVELARATMASMPGTAPIVVNSAGCGAALEDYGSLVGTPEAERFAARVVDVGEWLAERVDQLPTLPDGRRPQVIVQDPCHLRHVQRVHSTTRTVLAHVADIVELDDDGLCCGAGGAYSALQPELAGEIRTRKFEAIDRAIAHTAAVLMASANPGCSMHLQAGMGDRQLTVRHPVQIVADALGLTGE
jgi:glycolate oxidase iron-sulfur subunit